MKKQIVVGIIVLTIIGLSGCVDTEKPEYWTWELSAGEWINVTFTPQMINCAGSNETEILFASILNTSGELSVFQEGSPGDWDSWFNNRSYNTLEHIQPDIPCRVKAEKNCTLRIEKC